MLIELKEDIFNAANFRNINILLQTAFYKNRYNIFVEWTIVSQTALFSRLDEEDRALLEAEYNKVINDDLIPSYVISFTNNNEYFTPDEAIRFLNQPVSILLENSLNDAYFLNALVKHIDDTEELQRHLNNGWLQYENAGGASNIQNFINGKLNSFNSLPKADKSKYLRIFILLDSDKEYPSQEKTAIIRLETYLSNLSPTNIKHHILEKREMENYLPDEILEWIGLPYFDNYTKLSPLQKDYFDLEKGFVKEKNQADLDSNILALYGNVEDEKWEILKNGIPNTLYRRREVKSNFPQHFDLVFSKTALLTRTAHQTNPNELQDILDKITQLL